MTVYIDEGDKQQLLVTDIGTKVNDQKGRDKQLSCRKFSVPISNNIVRRKALRKLVKENSKCHHKHIYTQANAICRRISLSYEAEIITAADALRLILEAHEQMSHQSIPKRIVCRNMHAMLDEI